MEETIDEDDQVVLHPPKARPYRYSWHSQWLPCEVSFAGENAAVQITSYFNNLHPVSYCTLYQTIEAVIASSIQPWNDVLVLRNRPRKPPRMRCYGVPLVPPYPPWAYDLSAIERDKTTEGYRTAKDMVAQYLMIPNQHSKKPGLPIKDFSLETCNLSAAMERKHMYLKYG